MVLLISSTCQAFAGYLNQESRIMNGDQKNRCIVVLGIFLLLGGAKTARTQVMSGSPSPIQDKTDQTRNPFSWFKWGTDVRFRHESIENPSLTEADPPGHSYSFEPGPTTWCTAMPWIWTPPGNGWPSVPPRARCGSARTRATTGSPSPSTCRRCKRWLLFEAWSGHLVQKG